tara:strand:+ start:101 stop:271 length:171 start_codon:yes stop_codon:yes gene_type:complete
VEYDFIRSNRLFFKADIDVLDTDWVSGSDFAIFYQTGRKGQIDFGIKKTWDYKKNR